MNRIGLALCFIAGAFIPLFAQTNIDRMEYFFDSDPGIGSGIAISITPGPIQNVVLTIDTSPLSVGFHTLTVRARHQTTNVWGVAEYRVVYVGAETVGSLAQINALEYYFDSDPGPGNGTPVGISGSPTNIFESPTIATSPLSTGFHVLHMRVRDNNGVWGIPDSRVFYVVQGSILDETSIVAFEYFFDTDPGIGAATQVTFGTGSAHVELPITIPVSALTTGFHSIHIRAKDVEGVWGFFEKRTFYLDDFGQITELEYFVDTDPGEGNATSVTITPGGVIDESFTIPTGSLVNGSHTIGVRAARTDGAWGNVLTSAFSLLESQTITFNSLSAVTYGDAPFDLTGTTSSGLDITYTSSNPLVATISDATVTIVGAGTTTITASQAGDGSYAPAVDTDQVLVVNKATQSITFGALDIKRVGDAPFTLSGSSSSALGLTYSSSNTAVATISGNTVTIVSGGTTNITASQPGNGNYNAATDVVQALVVEPANNAPSLSVQPGTVFFSNSPIPITSTIAVTDADGIIVSATVAITAGFQSAEDELLFTSQNGIDGSYNNSNGVLTIAGNASVDNYQTALRSVQYNNTSSEPNTADRTISFQINDGVTTSTTVTITVTINKPPVIEAPSKDTQAGGNVAFPIDDIFSDPDGNLDYATLSVVSKQGALVTIAAGIITVNYSAIPDFEGTDELTMTICDTAGKCQTQVVTVDIGADVDVFNGISANADGMNDYMRIRFLPTGSQVSIFNRWGDAVFGVSDYDNTVSSKRFEGNGKDGNALTSGTYFYKIILPDGRERVGYIHLKR